MKRKILFASVLVLLTGVLVSSSSVGAVGFGNGSNSVDPLEQGRERKSNGEWIPYVPSAEQTEIRILARENEVSPLKVKVTIQFSDMGYKVKSWGEPRKSGSAIIVESKIMKWTGPSAQALKEVSHIYRIDSLSLGRYCFTFMAWEEAVESKCFEVPLPPRPRNTPPEASFEYRIIPRFRLPYLESVGLPGAGWNRTPTLKEIKEVVPAKEGFPHVVAIGIFRSTSRDREDSRVELNHQWKIEGPGRTWVSPEPFDGFAVKLYRRGGVFTATLEVTDPEGASDNITKKIKVPRFIQLPRPVLFHSKRPLFGTSVRAQLRREEQTL